MLKHFPTLTLHLSLILTLSITKRNLIPRTWVFIDADINTLTIVIASPEQMAAYTKDNPPSILNPERNQTLATVLRYECPTVFSFHTWAVTNWSANIDRRGTVCICNVNVTKKSGVDQI